MKPLSPILFLTAVQTVVWYHDEVESDADVAVEFVQQLGTIAHLEGTFASSSWPLQGLTTIDEVLAKAQREGMVRRHVAAGDVLIFRQKGARTIGVVLAVLQHGVGPMGRSVQCLVAHGRREPEYLPRVAVDVIWARPEQDDVSIRWYEGTRLKGMEEAA
jgi:hypothetical protein